MEKDKIGYEYLNNLQCLYHKISNRGICVDVPKLEAARASAITEIRRNCVIASEQWKTFVYVGAANKPQKGVDSVNLNATQGEAALLKKLQSLGYKIPRIPKKDSNGEYTSGYSTGELSLQKMLADNQFSHPGGDPAIIAILCVRELGKLVSAYLNARLYKRPDGTSYYLSTYNCGGTLSGRRSSKKHTFGYGNNGQNFPKHGDSAKIYRECLVARRGNIFLFVDQKAAEEWPVQALAQNHTALAEMLSGVNRHIKRASAIFQKPEASLTEREWKDNIMYYLGKKTGHANNYGMQAARMSDSLAQEGISMSKAMCQHFLDQINAFEPNTHGVFHKYIREELFEKRLLKNPFGRERYFLGLRPNDNNTKILNEAFSWIPQGTVGDNNGFAVASMEEDTNYRGAIVQECHDSIAFDIRFDINEIQRYYIRAERAYKRTITMHNGISFQIPIEAEIGFNFANTIKLKNYERPTISAAIEQLRSESA